MARHKRAFDFFLAATVPEVSYPSHACNRILSLAIMEGDVPLVQRILTCGLRPRADGYNGQVRSPQGIQCLCCCSGCLEAEVESVAGYNVV